MNLSGKTDKSTSSFLKSSLSKWLSYRQKRFWILVLVLLYTLGGFVLAPVIIENKLTSLFEDDLGRKVRINNIDVNPYVLSLRVQGFELDDKDEVPLTSFSEFFVNLQLSSIYYRAWTFEEISLDQAFLMFERFDETDSRLSRLLADFARLRPEEPVPDNVEEDEASMPRLLVHNLNLRNATVDVRDNVPESVVETRLSPIDISVQSLNTLPDKTGSQSVTIKLADDATLRWEGSISLGPLESSGELVLEKLRLDPVIAYLRSSLPLESFSAQLSTRFAYHVFMDLGGKPELRISDLSLEIGDIGVTGLTPATEFFSVDDILLSGGQLQYPEQTLSFAKLDIKDPFLNSWIKENGEPGLNELLPEDAPPAGAEDATGSSTPWSISIDDIRLQGGRIEVTDNSVTPAANIHIEKLDVSLSDVNNREGTEIPLKLEGGLSQGGRFVIDGNARILPDLAIETRISTMDIPLKIGQPYAQRVALIDINSGTLDSDVELRFSTPQKLGVSGSLRLPSLDISQQRDQSRLLSWNLLEIDRFEYNLEANSLNLSEMTFDQLYGVLTLDENKVTNISELLVEQREEVEDSGESLESASPMTLVIGGIVINDSSMDFSDRSLPLPFSTHIVNLKGSVSIIDTSSDAPANINLEGQVDEYGLARINGSINVLDPINHTDIEMEFRNLSMSNLSPYTVQFAGWEIEKGKLELDLGYAINNGLLNGSNNVVLSELELGEKIDHPDAGSLPLGLAVSLLKDADGVIKVDLPVEGDINDPEFEIGGVIWQAVSGFIGKIVSAPFRLLGKLIGIDSENLGQFEFLAGRSDLTPPELEKIVQLQQALQQRPELIIEIAGVVDPAIDTVALKKSRLIAEARTLLGEELDAEDDRAIMLDERIREVVRTMFRERFPDVDTGPIKAQHTHPPEDDPEGTATLDELAYATALWDRLVESEPVGDTELMALATARAQSIGDAFISSGEIPADRIVIVQPKEVQSEDATWVVLELSVAPN